MRAFVTGATGFVGGHLARALVARRDAVTCLARRPAGLAAQGLAGVRAVAGDLRDRAALRDGLAEADVAFHVAGRISARSAAEFLATNRDGTARVLEAARDRGVGRFVYVSSLSAAGPTVPGRPIDESQEPAPITDYGRSKLAGEQLVRTSGIPWTIVRPPVVYGEWDRATLTIYRLARLGVVPVFGDGRQELSLIHAADLAAALIAAATAERAADRVYFAAHPERTTSGDFARAIGRALGRAPRLVPLPPWLTAGALRVTGTLAALVGRATLLSADKAREYLAPAWSCRSDALTRDTGWRAELDLAAGLGRAVAWYRERGWL